MHPIKSERMMTDNVDEGKAGERNGALEISTDNAHLTIVSSTGPATPSLTPAGSTSSPPNSPYRLVCRHWKSFGRRTIGRVKGMVGIGGGAAKIAAVSQRHGRHLTSVRNMRRGEKTMDKNGAHHGSDRDPQGAASGSVLLSGARSVKGMNRPDKANEDKFFQFDDLFSATCVPPPDGIEKLGAFGVFDGHGGASCSSFVCRHLPVEVARSREWKRLAPVGIESFKREPVNTRSDELLSDVMRGALLDGFRKTQEKFLEFANARSKDSGSTAVVALVCGRDVVVANLGDSEALFCDNCTLEGNSEPIIARTQCHDAKNVAERERVEAAGGTFSKGRLFGMLCPTRSFGDRDIIRIKEGVLTAVPEVQRYKTLPTTDAAAFLLLGTDGLWGNVSEDKVVGLIQADFRRRAKRNRAAKPSRIAEALIREAGKIFLGDDATAVVVLFT